MKKSKQWPEGAWLQSGAGLVCTWLESLKAPSLALGRKTGSRWEDAGSREECYCSAMQQSRCHGAEVAFGEETITLSTPEPAVWNFLVTKP